MAAVATTSPEQSTIRDGIRVGMPFALAAFPLAISFGVLAEPIMGAVAPIVMSIIVFAGGAQFAALSVLLAGGGATAAVTAGLLMNARFLPMGFAIGPSLRGGRWKRAAVGQPMTDASWAIASRGDGTFDIPVMLGATVPQFIGWVAGTAVGVFAGDMLGDPQTLGLDAIFPAFYLALLFAEARDGSALAAAILGGATTLILMPFAPAGVPVIAAAGAAVVIGLVAHQRSDGGDAR